MWFDVDKEGLAKLLERRGKHWVLAEVVQNAWDAPGATRVDVYLEPVPGRPLAELTVVDDSPDGFTNLSHAFTLFAESGKKGDPTKRGRFNLGEKLVLAICDSASIASTTGTIVFGPDGREEFPRRKRPAGTTFHAVVRMNRDELQAALASVRSFLPPQGIATTVNGERLTVKAPLREFEHTLPTEIADGAGVLRRGLRKTNIRVLAPPEGVPGRLFEMGIPVVETGDAFDVDVGQKVPLSLERDSVTPAYLRELRAAVLSHAADLLASQAASSPWIDDALENRSVSPQAVETVLRARYGDKIVAYDPSDREANDIAVSRGYKVLHGGAFSKEAWTSVRASGFARPAGQVTPSPKPFDPNGAPAEYIEPDENMETFAVFAKALARESMGVEINVAFLKQFNAAAAYGNRRLTFNVSNLGRDWFAAPLREDQLDLLIHEFGHQYSGNHLSRDFSDALTKLGAKIALLASKDPGLLDLESYHVSGPSP